MRTIKTETSNHEKLNFEFYPLITITNNLITIKESPYICAFKTL